MKKTIFFSLLFLVITVVPLAQHYVKGSSLNEVIIEHFEQQLIKASVLTSGQLKHEQEIKLSAEVIGRISEVHVIEGEKVKKGQLLLEIDDQAFKAAVQQQEAVVNQQKAAIERQRLIVSNLERQFSRKKQLFETKLLDEDSYELLRHKYKVAQVDLRGSFELLNQTKAQLEQAKNRLSKTKVHSPINGTITLLDIKVGETAISSSTNIQGSSLMTIANTSSMLAEVNVDQTDIANIKVGQKAEIVAISYEDQPITAVVESIASSARAVSGRQSLSFIVKLRLNNEKKLNLLPGMVCRAEIFVHGEQRVLAVPIKAIRTEEDNENNKVDNFVFVFKEGVARKIKVETGISDDSFLEIVSGLNEYNSIIIGPDKVVRHLKDGDSVASR